MTDTLTPAELAAFVTELAQGGFDDAEIDGLVRDIWPATTVMDLAAAWRACHKAADLAADLAHADLLPPEAGQ